MKRITQQEALQIPVKQSKRPAESRNEHIYRELNLLTVGEALIVEEDDWKTKSAPAPSMFPSRVTSNQRAYKVARLADESGWIISRTA